VSLVQFRQGPPCEPKDLAGSAKSFFPFEEEREEGMGEDVPGGSGGIPGGVNAPVASGREPAGTTEGGDNFPRRCRTRGEANRAQIPFL